MASKLAFKPFACICRQNFVRQLQPPCVYPASGPCQHFSFSRTPPPNGGGPGPLSRHSSPARAGHAWHLQPLTSDTMMCPSNARNLPKVAKVWAFGPQRGPSQGGTTAHAAWPEICFPWHRVHLQPCTSVPSEEPEQMLTHLCTGVRGSPTNARPAASWPRPEMGAA